MGTDPKQKAFSHPTIAWGQPFSFQNLSVGLTPKTMGIIAI
jgi:hypothetical protein